MGDGRVGYVYLVPSQIMFGGIDIFNLIMTKLCMLVDVHAFSNLLK